MADFWLAGTSSGNLVIAKVMRGSFTQWDKSGVQSFPSDSALLRCA